MPKIKKPGGNGTDREIDQLVYELYGLTDEEIRIIEDATATKGQ